jgi:hypothetical protein
MTSETLTPNGPRLLVAWALVLAGVWQGSGGELPRMPVPTSPYIAVVYRFADALLDQGRDNFGPKRSGLILSALNRDPIAPLTNRPPAPSGIRESDRVGAASGPLTGANPQHDENLLRLLYTLSELSSKPKYRDAANGELQWFLQNAASPETGLLAWGEHMSWDTVKDAPINASRAEHGTHEFFRPWLLWDHCFELASEASKRFAIGLWEHQIADHQTGAFDRHAAFSRHESGTQRDFPRHAGFYIRTWAMAYSQTRDEQFLKPIEVMLGRFEKKRGLSTGVIEAYAGHSNAWLTSSLSLAIDCDGAAHQAPEALAGRLRKFAAREDEIFCALPHNPKRDGGFISKAETASGKYGDSRTSLWEAHYGGDTTAQVGMMCVSRYENTGKVGYRQLVVAAADAYHDSSPSEEADAWPATFGQAISLQLAAWRYSADASYLEQARRLADLAVVKFWGGRALPKASLKTDHYESITGADTLALSLLELHLHVLHITAVRYPPNTIDR